MAQAGGQRVLMTGRLASAAGRQEASLIVTGTGGSLDETSELYVQGAGEDAHRRVSTRHAVSRQQAGQTVPEIRGILICDGFLEGLSLEEWCVLELHPWSVGGTWVVTFDPAGFTYEPVPGRGQGLMKAIPVARDTVPLPRTAAGELLEACGAYTGSTRRPVPPVVADRIRAGFRRRVRGRSGT